MTAILDFTIKFRVDEEKKKTEMSFLTRATNPKKRWHLHFKTKIPTMKLWHLTPYATCVFIDFFKALHK